MTGIENITGRIQADAQAEIDRIDADARAQADKITAAYAALSGDEEGDAAGAADLLGGASTSLGESARLDESLAPLSERLDEL